MPMPRTNGEVQPIPAVTAKLATLRRIADALNEIAGTLAAIYRDSKEGETLADINTL